MTSRNVLILLSVVFVLVLFWNALYFTGVVGDFGVESTAPQFETPDQFDIPGLQREEPQRPRPSGQPGTRQSVQAGPRDSITATDLAIGDNWGRNPFLTPREIWAIENYEVVPVVTAATPATGLLLSGVMLDSDGRRMAVINDNVVGIGDIVAGMEVIDVWEDAVVFRVGGERHVLRMNDAAIRLTVRGDGTGGQ